MHALKVTQVGNSLGVILSKEVIARLKVQKGDVLYLTDAPDGMRLSPYQPSAAEQLAQGRQFMHDFRETFRELAK